MIFALTICLGLAALALRYSGTIEAIILLTQACLIVIMVTILEFSGRRSLARSWQPSTILPSSLLRRSREGRSQ